jgi:hypothetical protein
MGPRYHAHRAGEMLARQEPHCSQRRRALLCIRAGQPPTNELLVGLRVASSVSTCMAAPMPWELCEFRASRRFERIEGDAKFCWITYIWVPCVSRWERDDVFLSLLQQASLFLLILFSISNIDILGEKDVPLTKMVDFSYRFLNSNKTLLVVIIHENLTRRHLV